MLPEDIIESIKNNSNNSFEAALILELCLKIKSMNLNVGNDQLIRSALVVSAFTSNKLENIIKMKFNGDPRDILVQANEMNPRINYGITKFENKS